jgi:Zn-dependent protease
MLLSFLFTNPSNFIAAISAIIVALTFHEFSHALAASLMGDMTAKDERRLTLNPLAHISWMGLLFLVLAGFGWGKPVPFNPYNLKYPKWGPALVALAGPVSNLFLAVSFGLILKAIIFWQLLPFNNLLIIFLFYCVILNINLLLFNLLPLAPLDGSKILFAFFSDTKFYQLRQFLEKQGPIILIFLLILDGTFNVDIFGSLFRGVIQLAERILL